MCEWRAFFRPISPAASVSPSGQSDEESVLANTKTTTVPFPSQEMSVFGPHGLCFPASLAFDRCHEVRVDEYLCGLEQLQKEGRKEGKEGEEGEEGEEGGNTKLFGVKLRGNPEALEVKARTVSNERVEHWEKILHAPFNSDFLQKDSPLSERSTGSADTKGEPATRTVRDLIVASLRRCADGDADIDLCASLLESCARPRLVRVEKLRVKVYYRGYFVEETDIRVKISPADVPTSEETSADQIQVVTGWRTVSVEGGAAHEPAMIRLAQFVRTELGPFLSAVAATPGGLHVMVGVLSVFPIFFSVARRHFICFFLTDGKIVLTPDLSFVICSTI
jgi:hypothetical protein